MAALGAVAATGAGAQQDESAGEPWGLAPLRWRGVLSADWRSFSAEAEPRRSDLVENLQLQAASYFWQPWFAQLQGGIGAFHASGRGGGEHSDSSALTGNGMLSLFPVSRFPFQASFELTDTRASDQFTGQDYETRRFGVRQAHRDLSGEATSSAAYDRSLLDSSTQGRDTLDVLAASHGRRLGAHALDASANLARNEREASAERSEFTRLSGRHAWAQGGPLSVDTTASYGASDQRLASGGTLAAQRAELFQLTSFFSRRRDDEDDPWSLTGGARYFQSESSGADTSQSLAGHFNAAYRYSRELLLNAGVSATETSAGATEEFFTTQSAGATYSPQATRLGEYAYSATLGASFLNQTGGDAGARQVLSGQAGHNLQRAFDAGEGRTLSATVSQSLADAHDSEAGNLVTLNHSASLAWRLTSADALAGFVSATAADSRTRGHSESMFQLANLQLSGQAQASRDSTLLANLTLQATRQGTAENPPAGWSSNVNGGITYQHQRVFGVPRLRYLAAYERNDYRLNTRQQGDLSAPREQWSESFEQRLEYRIGKLEARFSVRFAEIDGKENALVFLRLAREFGAW